MVWETKGILTTWGFDRAGIWADPESGTVWVGDDWVIKGQVEGRDLKVEYGKDWEAYMCDAANPQFTELLAAQKAKLATGKVPTKGVGKGKGKGAKVNLT